MGESHRRDHKDAVIEMACAGEMAQHVKTLTIRPDGLNSILRTHVVEGESTNSCQLSSNHILSMPYANSQNKCYKYCFTIQIEKQPEDAAPS